MSVRLKNAVPADRVRQATTTIDHRMVEAVERLGEGALPWQEALSMMALSILKDELPFVEPEDEDSVVLNIGMLKGWVKTIRADVKGIMREGPPKTTYPELEDILGVLHEFTYEFDEKLAEEIDTERRDLCPDREEVEESEREAELEKLPPKIPGSDAPEPTAVEPPEESAMDFLKRVEARAKELYALSNQGTWTDLDTPLQEVWINSARRELEGKD